MHRPVLRAGLFAGLVLLLAPFSRAAEGPPVRQVTVNGTAVLKVVPDQMLWSVQVTVRDATLAKAKARHDASLAAALKYLKGLGKGIDNLQTGGIRFDRQTYFPEGSDRAKPFSCSTAITFTLTDFDQYGPITDALAQWDGLEVQSIDYAYAKEIEVRRNALKQALVAAREKAALLAETADCALGAPLKIIEGGGGIQPRVLAAGYSVGLAKGTPAPEAGQIEISASVSATYELKPR